MSNGIRLPPLVTSRVHTASSLIETKPPAKKFWIFRTPGLVLLQKLAVSSRIETRPSAETFEKIQSGPSLNQVQLLFYRFVPVRSTFFSSAGLFRFRTGAGDEDIGGPERRSVRPLPCPLLSLSTGGMTLAHERGIVKSRIRLIDKTKRPWLKLGTSHANA